MIIGRNLIEKMYSENYDEYEDTRLYSTGDDELDDLLERAFCDGYEYAQKEFGNKENKKFFRDKLISQIRSEAAEEGVKPTKKQENMVLGLLRKENKPLEVSLGIKPKPIGTSELDKDSNRRYISLHVDEDKLNMFNKYREKFANKDNKNKKYKIRGERVRGYVRGRHDAKELLKNHLTKLRPDLIDNRINMKSGYSD